MSLKGYIRHHKGVVVIIAIFIIAAIIATTVLLVQNNNAAYKAPMATSPIQNSNSSWNVAQNTSMNPIYKIGNLITDTSDACINYAKSYFPDSAKGVSYQPTTRQCNVYNRWYNTMSSPGTQFLYPPNQARDS